MLIQTHIKDAQITDKIKELAKEKELSVASYVRIVLIDHVKNTTKTNKSND